LPTVFDRIDQALFDAIYRRALVYNTCWEDPAVDRAALNFRPDDTVLVITSAGCNVLDYALTGPRRIHAVDANPRQTAPLELKLAPAACSRGRARTRSRRAACGRCARSPGAIAAGRSG
jgi:S-adenosylmethionine-diacylglycerol 3-amino-3-carboxypropyl transferase